MNPSTPRPSTPPRRTGLLTPPSTGGLRKRELFVVPQESPTNPRRQNKSHVHEGELLGEYFKDLNEGSDAHECSAGDFATSASSTTPGAARFEGPKAQSASTTTFVAVLPSGPFPFLKLPLSVRNMIYGHLLVIPAIICVRQKHTVYHDEKKAFLYAERRELLPGIAFDLAQTKVDGFKTHFSRFANINLNILRASKEIFSEARAVMYSKNEFEVVKPSNEQTPEPDFSIPLFPPGYQRLVIRLNIRVRTFYDLDWLLSGGYNVMRNYYRGLDTLTLILEMDSATKGFGRKWSRKKSENWVTYIKRLQRDLADDLFDGVKPRDRTIPTCLNLRVLFSGKTYDGSSGALTEFTGISITDSTKIEQSKHEELRNALVESWELLKKGGR
ncbi:uncharacterized protein M421DRAFT_390023 [Didymella exigua CBS 183.55]|uniref:Uncharacterized protein n=1 Tax=Didymella exigua CBS 183.55 TaxID=1150837 RepID=A0A6A5RPW8_9PLEO|nr:uncharacterized protein M421DRAFT_390023 [Didymella exigua CBS 183.55]KAF1929208.1 hypothetical protein M421DRAFT_390023 [Didymella exigua CBS 183.55]